MKTPSRPRPPSARALARVFRNILVMAAAPAVIGAAACGPRTLGREDYTCEGREVSSTQTYDCPALPAEQSAQLSAQDQDAAASSDGRPDGGVTINPASCEARCAHWGPGDGCIVREPRPGQCEKVCTVVGFQPCGRRPAGLSCLRKGRAQGGVGAYLAASAQLEAASVDAFETLAGELSAHGAPGRLIAVAKKSAEDERRHTRVTRALARRFGGDFVAPRVRRARARSLGAMALENAVEGCVREAYGALLATYQAEHAEDPRVRRAMGVIAADETAHAALAFRVAAWVEGRLSDGEKRALRAAMRRASRKLVQDVAAPVDPEMARHLGLPAPEVAVAMARGLCAELGTDAPQGALRG